MCYYNNRFKIVLLLLSGAMLFNFVDYWPIRDVGYFTGFLYGNKDQTYCNETGVTAFKQHSSPGLLVGLPASLSKLKPPMYRRSQFEARAELSCSGKVNLVQYRKVVQHKNAKPWEVPCQIPFAATLKPRHIHATNKYHVEVLRKHCTGSEIQQVETNL